MKQPRVEVTCPVCHRQFLVGVRRFRCKRVCCSRACKHKIVISLEERFWAKVRKTNSCWWWTGTFMNNKKTYGVLGDGTSSVCKRWLAHRLSYTLHFGNIPEGMLVCHKCDNPSCVNPEHLFLGTHEDNNQDCRSKGRAVQSNHPRGRLTEADVKLIRNLRGEEKMQLSELAERFNVSVSTIIRVVQQTTWKHVTG